MYFWLYGLKESMLDHCLKSPVSEDPSTSTMVKWPKHCWNLNDSTFNIFIDTCESNSGWESVFELYGECKDRFITHLLLITSILFLVETIYSNTFRCNYLRNKKYFPIFFAFCKFRFNFEHSPKKDDPHTLCIFELKDSKRRG